MTGGAKAVDVGNTGTRRKHIHKSLAVCVHFSFFPTAVTKGTEGPFSSHTMR